MTRTDTVLYLAGPYSKDPEACTREAIKVQSHLFKAGWSVICPHANSHFADRFHRLPPVFYYDMDLEILRRCDGIVMLPGWEESVGARGEWKEAKRLGKAIFHWPLDKERLTKQEL